MGTAVRGPRQGAYRVVINLRDLPSRRGPIRRWCCVAREQLTDPEWEFIGPYLPIGEYGAAPNPIPSGTTDDASGFGKSSD